jgi:hypothetical protein
MARLLGTVVLAVAMLTGSALQGANVLFQATNTAVYLGLPAAQLELSKPLTGKEKVLDYKVLDWRDADYTAGSPPSYADWTVHTNTSYIDGNPSEIWMRQQGQWITTTTMVSSTVISIHMTGDNNDGVGEVLIDGTSVAKLNMYNYPLSQTVLIIASNLNYATHVVRVNDLGPMPNQLWTDVHTFGAAALRATNSSPKWVQPPVAGDTTNVFLGWNEASGGEYYPPFQIAADDWVCTNNLPVTALRWWGSYPGWTGTTPPPNAPALFNFCIWTDIPKQPVANSFSHPGQVIWQFSSANVGWKFVGWDYDPRSGTYDACFEYYQALPQAQWFKQDPTPGTNVYWLSIAATSLQGVGPVWGWKTVPRNTNAPSPDAAVRIFNPLNPVLGSPYVAGQEINYPTNGNPWDLAFELISSSTGTAAKWTQPPDLTQTGMDVNDTVGQPPFLLADDFQCTNNGPLTQITVWGSWREDLLPANNPANVQFTLSIHQDIPAHGTIPSQPGAMLWSKIFPPGQFQVVTQQANILEWWMDPPAGAVFPGDKTCYKYTFAMAATEAFVQQGTPQNPIIYWLDVQAMVIGGTSSTLFGWKTSLRNWNDAAVWANAIEPPAYPGPWNALAYPPQHPKWPQPIDLAFALSSTDEVTEIKWSQPPMLYTPPNTFNGWNESSVYGAEQIVADDWLCTTPQPVTDIHWWGSFLGWSNPDSPPLPDAFRFSIWTDVPQQPDVNPFSHPGTVIWQAMSTNFDWVFAGWDVDSQNPTALPEACFKFDVDLDPPDWFYQEPGKHVYWISIAAIYNAGQMPTYPWGWKTRPRDPNSPAPDDAVRISVPTAPTLGSMYQQGRPIEFPAGTSWDMAFELTTEPALDFGDAPDPPFPTLLASDGARHALAPGVFLGKLIDAELNGQPNATATGDDINGLADEDGVVLSGGFMVPGDWATAIVTASTNGFLSAWVDFQADGSWATPGDQIFTNLALPAGTNTLYFYVPTKAAQGSNVFARFRFSTMQITNFTGLALDGEVEDYMWYVAEVDYGDAPDPTFPTLHASNGARHWRFPNLQLGALWDGEVDGQPNATATGDDLANLRDEDGVQLLTPMLPGQVAWIRVLPSLPNTFLSAWIDFGADGSWAQPTDQIFLGFRFTAAGPTNLSFIVPTNAAAGSNVFARFRYSTAPVLSYTNQVGPPCMTQNGEVEDYMWRISQLDFGDAPDPPYPTWLTNNGAYHVIVPGFCLGTNVSGEWDGRPNATATGDLYDDGVFFVTPLTLSSQACVNVFLTAGTNGGKLDAWIDFDRNGTWDSSDQIFASRALVPGLNTNLCFTVPANAALGQTFARFRLSSAGGLSLTGYASDGEVEDYLVRITQRPLATNCVITNIFFQSMYYGWNEPSVYGSTNIAADDWICTTTNPLTSIRWWGSFRNWRSNTPPALPPAFHIAIWDDVPAMPPGGFSHPGQVLWVTECSNYAWQFAGWDFDPRAQTNETCFLFEQKLAPSEWFYQTNRPSGSNIYWISIAAMWPPAGPEPPYAYGWKTRPRAANSPAPDDAVRIFNPTAPYVGATYVQGEPIFWPDRTNSWDLAFELVSRYDETITKWEQPPDLSVTGVDVNDTDHAGMPIPPPYLLADDFKCQSTGPLTDITIWGSWTNDWETPQNLWFTLSIHSDIPAHGTEPSRPGPLLWQQTFLPGQYLYQLVQLPYQLYEGWLTPPMNYYFPADHACFQCDFPIQTDAFVQTNGTIYWLDVQAHLPPQEVLPAPAFGWKSTAPQYRWNDDAVWVNATEPYIGNAWTDLHYPPGHAYYPNSIDLAFRLAGVESVYQLKWSQPPVRSATNRYVTVEWNAETGIQYQLLATPSLGTNNGLDIIWSNVGSIVIGPAHSQDDLNATAAQRYYRVQVP